MEKRTTIRDIAQKTGVSVATVSNVINGINKVSDDKRKVVLSAMAELDYRPNLTARSLSINKSNLIGLLLPIIDGGTDASLLLRDNPFYGEFVSGVEYRATDAGYDILISGVRPGQSCRDWILKRNLDGVIFIGNYTSIISQDIREFGSQLVLVDSYDEGTQKHHSIGIDDTAGGYLATEHLLKRGHRGIAIAASNILVEGAIYRRFKGYQTALSEYGVTKLNRLVFQDILSFDGGYRIGLRLLEHLDEISAVFAVADIMAFGIMKAFFEHGKRIPQDLSIVGFDNTRGCEYSNPALTSINQPVYEKGVIAVETLLEAITDSDIPKRSISLPTELVERSSTIQYEKG